MFQTQDVMRSFVPNELLMEREVHLKVWIRWSRLARGLVDELNTGNVFIVIQTSKVHVPVQIQN